MFISIEKQLKLIRYFLEQPEFKWKAIINDIRMLPFLSWYKKAINEVKLLSSLKIFLPDNIWFSLWKWYPPKFSKLLIIYEKLSKKWLELDFEVIRYDLYKEMNKNIIIFNWTKVLFKKYNNIKEIYTYIKITNFNICIDNIINSYLTVIKADDNIIKYNLQLYKNKYKKYIDLKNDLIKEKCVKYKDELINYFIDYRLFEFKNRIKFYRTLESYWFETLDDVFSWKKLDIKSINYYKNISVKKEKYIWICHKVYNVVSSKQMKKDYIMIAENTNPEFIEAFYKASFICVETSSELSHAAITCKELKIPLALWAKNIFLATSNLQKLNIDTKKQTIY